MSSLTEHIVATAHTTEWMSLTISLPYRVFLKEDRVTRITVDTTMGSLGILPRRLDCAAALAPGILQYECEAKGLVYLAVDEGALVKAGSQVRISVRRAIGGADLGRLREAIDCEWSQHDERERTLRATLAKLEIGMIRRFAELRHE